MVQILCICLSSRILEIICDVSQGTVGVTCVRWSVQGFMCKDTQNLSGKWVSILKVLFVFSIASHLFFPSGDSSITNRSRKWGPRQYLQRGTSMKSSNASK